MGSQPGWPLRYAGEDIVLPVTGNAQASDGEALRHLALAGPGLARQAVFQVREDIAADPECVKKPPRALAMTSEDFSARIARETIHPR
ncbi:hypothetical protein PS639_00708 [Pseudomonas fluorescens]|nr:hypothetical protein PS639_00708 [Pseudomonas fluorescens]